MIKSDPDRELAAIGVRLIDDAHMAWLLAARDCERAMAAWRADEPGAYWAYRAAIDREEAAARDLERLSKLARPCRDALDVWGEVRQPDLIAQFSDGPRSPRRSTQQ
jgi:hypothetical protein